MHAHDRLPVTLLTGFLGSGKTTLLNRLLHRSDMDEALVIVNEFGEIAIDHVLLESGSEDVILLPSGCLCCTVRGALVDTLRTVVMKRDAGSIPAFRRVLIETTGLADPLPIAQTLMSVPVANRYRLDAILTTVDSCNGLTTLRQFPEAMNQVAVADHLLLTKCDVADSSEVTALCAELARINPGAPLVVATEGLAPAELFDTAIFDTAKRRVDVPNWLRAERYSVSGRPRTLRTSSHAQEIESFCIAIDTPLRWAHATAWLDLLRDLRGESLLRVKGILNIEEANGPVVIHAVQRLFHPPIELERWPSEDQSSRVVFITRGLPPSTIEDLLTTLRSAPS